MCILSYICDIVHTSRNSLELTGSRSAPTCVPGSRPDVKYCCEICLHRVLAQSDLLSSRSDGDDGDGDKYRVKVLPEPAP